MSLKHMVMCVLSQYDYNNMANVNDIKNGLKTQFGISATSQQIYNVISYLNRNDCIDKTIESNGRKIYVLNEFGQYMLDCDKTKLNEDKIEYDAYDDEYDETLDEIPAWKTAYDAAMKAYDAAMQAYNAIMKNY